ncbi:PREDICTED: CDGSH iron-sulfur domain-containing protein 2 isoform X1 [Colobus angolensis palliatus]|uniref:CDGSH iron-sulfur domain-containing protein 2 isoform X1 n=1 Tax=Colobus angolensis palliatus TaxID=336983 RepID=UPI0005F4EBEB|nr:PREDICTED: CDGSH iron-sulfur domain-containing protein 2 isoform X1 [Colobus angolensis palliatus]
MVLESVARIVKVQLPAYLKRLPVPESITGFARLTVSEWLRLLPFLGVLALLGYLAVRPFLQKKKQQKDSLINLKIQKENPKVVNEINIEDLCLAKAAYCRCWRSKTVRCLFTCTRKFCSARIVLSLKFPVLKFFKMKEFSVTFDIERPYS